MAYATQTTVDVAKTKTDIEKLLVKHGATGFAIAWLDHTEALAFEIGGRRIRFTFPVITETDLKYDSAGRQRTAQTLAGGTLKTAVAQAQRTRWRELLLLIRAKLVAIESGITTVEEEFLSHIVLPDGQTMHEWSAPYLKHAYLKGQMPPMLPPASKG